VPATFSWLPSYVLLQSCFSSGDVVGLASASISLARQLIFLPGGRPMHNLFTGMISVSELPALRF
jgi:hypothetical protein